MPIVENTPSSTGKKVLPRFLADFAIYSPARKKSLIFPFGVTKKRSPIDRGGMVMGSECSYPWAAATCCMRLGV